MQIKWWYCLTVAVLIADLVSKALLDGKTMDVINGFFGFVSVHNTGASFGLFAGAQTFFIIISVVFALGMLAFDLFYKRKFGANGWYYVGFTLILGGLLGNLIDRIAFGYVRDFIHLEFMDFPVFNIADISLTIGCICIIVFLLFFCRTDSKKKESASNLENSGELNEKQNAGQPEQENAQNLQAKNQVAASKIDEKATNSTKSSTKKEKQTRMAQDDDEFAANGTTVEFFADVKVKSTLKRKKKAVVFEQAKHTQSTKNGEKHSTKAKQPETNEKTSEQPLGASIKEPQQAEKIEANESLNTNKSDNTDSAPDDEFTMEFINPDKI